MIMDRNQQIIRTSVVGIAANVLLAAFKAAVGVVAGSVAIVMDAVNNLSDALSSVITIIGTKLSERPADRMHPFGHGRVEYFSGIVIAVIVLVAGVSSLVESVKKVLHPSEPTYTALTLSIVGVAIVVKVVLGRYVRGRGVALHSDALTASGADALFDAVITLATLVSAVVMLVWGVSVDGWLGAAISLIIVKSGVEMLRSPINELLGSRVSPEVVTRVKALATSFEGVESAHDVILHTYGPDTMIGSLHVCVPDTTSASDIHRLGRAIAERLHAEMGIIATVGFYAVNTGNTPAARLQRELERRAAAHPDVHSIHGFYVDFDTHVVSFDVMPEYHVADTEALRAALVATLEAEYPGYTFRLVIDQNYSEE